MDITPPCPHYGQCGGCQLQHVSDEAIVALKTRVINEALEKYGLTPEKTYPIQTSPPASRRRAVFSAQMNEQTVDLGFYAQSSHALVAIQQCPVVTPQIEKSFDFLKQLARALQPWTKNLRFAVTQTQNGLDIDTKTHVTSNLEILETLQAICAADGSEYDIARISLDMTPVWQSKTPSQTFGSVSVLQSPGAFLQATKHGESVMAAFIKHHFKTKKHILDLFCGCGALSLPLYDTAKIDAYDSDETQINALLAATERQILSATIRNLFKQPVSDFSNYDGIIIDPPRAGAPQQFKEIASNTDLPVISVSCNPLTFARDAKILSQAGYQFKELLPIDQFRWSHHIEVVGLFRKS